MLRSTVSFVVSVTFGLLLHMSVVVADGPSRTGLVVNIQNYPGTAYIPAPKPDILFVFLQGDEIKVRIMLVNRQQDTARLLTNKLALADAFAITPIRRPDAAPLPAFTLSGAELTTPSIGPHPIDWGNAIDLSPESRVEIDAILYEEGTSLPVGTYEFRIQPLVREEREPGAGQVPIRLTAPTITFEVRAVRTERDHLEQLRRRAMRELSQQNYSGTMLYADQLLQAHPTSWVAYWLKGKSAVQLGDGRSAATAFDRAAEILEAEGDRAYIASPSGRLGDTAKFLRASARQQRERLRQ